MSTTNRKLSELERARIAEEARRARTAQNANEERALVAQEEKAAADKSAREEQRDAERGQAELAKAQASDKRWIAAGKFIENAGAGLQNGLSGGLRAQMLRTASQALPPDVYEDRASAEKAKETAHIENAGKQGEFGTDPTQLPEDKPLPGGKVSGYDRWKPGAANPLVSARAQQAYNLGKELAQVARNEALWNAQRGITASAMAFDVEQQANLLGESIATESRETQYRKVNAWIESLKRNKAYSPDGANPLRTG